jgi:hypothetical protein
MSHCIMYKDIADCDIASCEGCDMRNTSCNGECDDCNQTGCPNHPHFDPSPEICLDLIPDPDPCDVCAREGRRCIIEPDFTAEPGYCYAGRC